MKHLMIIAVLLLTVIVATAGNYPQPQQWEYKFEYSMNEKKANSLGSQGWDLSAIESTSAAGTGNNVPVYVFKRAK